MVVSPASLACAVDYGYTSRHRAAIEEWKAYAASCFPEEACAYLMEDGRLLPVRNVHPEAHSFFAVPLDDQKAVLAAGEPLAFLHSHTDGPEVDKRGRLLTAPDCPSADDMVSQQASGLAWGISCVSEGGAHDPFWFGDQLGTLPLIGRTFRPGVHDCMSLLRDWHAQFGISLPDQPRDDFWWRQGQDLYMEHFGVNGFEIVQRVAPEPGDVFLCKLLAPVLNHGGIYVGNGLILHHKPDRLSGTDPAHMWRHKFELLIRHRDLPKEL